MSNTAEAFGLDVELEEKKRSKYCNKLESEALNWIAELTGSEKDEEQSVHEFLKDGTVLCDLMNALEPGAISKIHAAKSMAFKHMENINHFLMAAEKYGVPRSDTFQTVDLYENKHLGQVINMIHALGREAQRPGKFTGPVIGVKPAEKNLRSFSEEVLNAGKFIASQHLGYNKGANQSGMIAPGGRRIVVTAPLPMASEGRN